MDIQKLFFELIRVVIGTQESLTRLLSQNEWEALYDMAMKQSLVGVCFAGLQRLGADADEGFARIGMSEDLYFEWMGMAVQINMKNEMVNQQCVILGERLKAEGYRCCILKGQGVASLYSEHLLGLRQSGDIDALLWKEGLSRKENREAVMQLARSTDMDATGSEHHVHAHFFEDTEVELHYESSYFCDPLANRKFRNWSEEHRKDMVWCEALGCMIPDADYNEVFLLSHMFRHYMSEGIGMRQMMDYYFVLRTSSDVPSSKFQEVTKTIESFGMKKFASGVMWLMGEVFKLERELMFCEPNERLGRKLLKHVMQGGNFGHHNKKTVASKESHAGRFINQLAHDLELAADYPREALWAPLSMIREFVRIRI